MTLRDDGSFGPMPLSSGTITVIDVGHALK
jgi:hypothetical protein